MSEKKSDLIIKSNISFETLMLATKTINTIMKGHVEEILKLAIKNIDENDETINKVSFLKKILCPNLDETEYYDDNSVEDKTYYQLYIKLSEIYKSTSVDNYPVTLTELSDDELRSIMSVCDIIGRVMMGQVIEILELSGMRFNLNPVDRPHLYNLKNLMFPELPNNGYYSVHSTEISDKVRQLFDIYQVIRHYLSWRDEDNTPETRNWHSQMTVNYDTPAHFSEQPLPEIKESK